MGGSPGLRTPAASLDSAKGPAATGRVRFQEFVLLWFSADRGWMPAGVASQKTGPVAGDIARFARPYTFGPGRTRKVSGLAAWTPAGPFGGPRKPAGTPPTKTGRAVFQRTLPIMPYG